MAFEAFPSEAVQQFNDPGPFFIRENGKLRSPPGMAPHSRSLLELDQESIPVMTKANSTNPSENTPRKLFDMTLDFIAANIVLVDSLVGFPEVVGQQLFEASHHHGNLSIKALRLFSDAYGDTILRSINLSGHHLAINQHTNCLSVFSYLTEMEVGDCRLGDDHEIISIIANCHSLTRLGLASNGLSDAGIQRLTAPLRVMGRGPRNLSMLDLAGNYLISDKSARQYLTVFTSLQAIDLSGCNISSAGLDVLKSKLQLETNNSTESPFQQPIKTIGWALPLVGQWIESSTEQMTRGKSKASKNQAHRATNAVNFYGRAQKRLENASKTSLPKPKPPVFPVIQLVAATYHGQPTSNPADKKVKRLKVEMSIDRLTKECTNPASCRQEVAAYQSKKSSDLSQTTFDKEIIEQYTIGLKDTVHKNVPSRKQQYWSSYDVDAICNYPKLSTETLVLKQEPVRITKPPPKKRIKLSTKDSRGFSDVLQDHEVKGVVHCDPTSDKESPANQQACDWSTSGGQSHMTFKGQRSCSDQRQSVKCVQGKKAESRKENCLWNAMNNEDWG